LTDSDRFESSASCREPAFLHHLTLIDKWTTCRLLVQVKSPPLEVSEPFPEIIDAESGEDPLRSCSALEALDRQEPFINQTLAASALAMLAQLFRYGKLTNHGTFFNAKSGKMSALPVDPDLWSKMRRRPKKVHSRRM
jgi:hypothetical protein